jgi:hypothetical protein
VNRATISRSSDARRKRLCGHGSGRANGSTSPATSIGCADHGSSISPGALASATRHQLTKKGKTRVIVLPVFGYVTKLLEAGAEIRSLGRVPFRDTDSDRVAKHPANIACFVLRPRARRQ